jgi:hypothetical protein
MIENANISKCRQHSQYSEKLKFYTCKHLQLKNEKEATWDVDIGGMQFKASPGKES